MATTDERLEAFRKIAFPRQLKALEQCLGATGFLRHLLPYYAKLAEPLQERKTNLLKTGRDSGRIQAGNVGQRAAYCRSTYYEPTQLEQESFKALQDLICRKTTLHHQDPNKTLFLQIDGALERGFGVMAFHLVDGYSWALEVPFQPQRTPCDVP